MRISIRRAYTIEVETVFGLPLTTGNTLPVEVTMPIDPLDLLAVLVLPDGRRWGDAATPEQWDDARAVFSPDGPRRHWIGRARGYAKTTDMGAFSLVALLVGIITPSWPGYVAAADRDQAGLLRDSIEDFVRRTPELRSQLRVDNWKITARSHAELNVLAADSSGVYGLRPRWLVLDELCQWSDVRGSKRIYEALTTSLAKIPDSRLMIITTAGTPEHFSKKVYDSALKHPELWRVHMIDGPAPWTSTKEIEADREVLGDSAVERLYYNRFTQADDALISGAELTDAEVLHGPQPPLPDRWYAWGLDVGLVNDATVLTICHSEPTRDDSGVPRNRVVLDRIWRWHGTRRRPVDMAEVEATIVEYFPAYKGAVYVDPHQAGYLMGRLHQRGIPAIQYDFTSTSVGVLASTLLRLFRSRMIWLPKDQELADELGAVRLVENSVGTLRLQHVSGGHDDQAVALALAAEALATPVGGPVIYADLYRGHEEEALAAGITTGTWIEHKRPDTRPDWMRVPRTSGIGATQRSPFARPKDPVDDD